MHIKLVSWWQLAKPIAISLVTFFAQHAHADTPSVLLPDVELKEVARAPDVVTPIGICFDRQGRLLVIESHTHQRPDDYDGPAGDRIRRFSDTDGDGDLDTWSTFAEPFQQAMNILPAPQGGFYLVTRRDVQRIEDRDQDGMAESRTQVLTLHTEVNYPHNGLSGIAVSNETLYVGLGENFGGTYTLVGSDNSQIEGQGGSGTIYTCSTAGQNVQTFCVGFWNPFSICLWRDQVFTVDNDPDASPPCRLIHAQRHADYGFRFEYGRPGVHPLQAWDGELPGTSPMICGTGEAPTAIIAHRNSLWVTSWGDHRIERYILKSNGGRYTADRHIVVQGNADFRPTGMAVAPDGSLYFADWVKRDYAVHGTGRIWKLTLPSPAPNEASTQETQSSQLPTNDGSAQQSEALSKLISTRWQDAAPSEALLRESLESPDADVRLYAVRWIAEARLSPLRDDIAKLLTKEVPNERYYLAILGALDWLDGDKKPRHSRIGVELARRELQHARRPPRLQAIALRLIAPDHAWLTLERLEQYTQSSDATLRREAIRTLAMRSDAERIPVLKRIAEDPNRSTDERADALVGLAPAAQSLNPLLNRYARSNNRTLRREADRILRITHQQPWPKETKPDLDDIDAWVKLVESRPGNAESGRRLFFLRAGANCSACHSHSGRGGNVGPDLSQLGRQKSTESILRSVIQPALEMAPRYQPWNLVLADGRTRTGLRMPRAGDNGEEIYVDASGKTFLVRSEDVALRRPAPISIMPDDLVRSLTIQDVRDLLAFLQ